MKTYNGEPTRKEKVKEYLQSSVWGSMCIAKISRDLDIPYSEITRTMSQLVKENVVSKFWHGKQMVYKINL